MFLLFPPSICYFNKKFSSVHVNRGVPQGPVLTLLLQEPKEVTVDPLMKVQGGDVFQLFIIT